LKRDKKRRKGELTFLLYVVRARTITKREEIVEAEGEGGERGLPYEEDGGGSRILLCTVFPEGFLLHAHEWMRCRLEEFLL